MTQLHETTWLEFRHSPIHGTGAFARCPIPEGTHIIEYVGEVISKKESMRRCEQSNQFIFALDDEWDIDGAFEWNPARYINHSCSPNAEAILSDRRIWIVAAQDIAAGEEVTFNYGYDLESYRDYPCRCGSANCPGFIVAPEFADKVRRD